MTRTERWTLTAAIIGSGIVFLDGTIVNLALKSIGLLPTSFLGVLEGQTYVVSGYLAVLSALLILAGALADYYGRRKIFAIGLTGFGIASLLCGIAPTLELLVLFRLLQGAAGALERARDDRQRARHEQRAGRSLQEAEQDEELEGRRNAAEE